MADLRRGWLLGLCSDILRHYRRTRPRFDERVKADFGCKDRLHWWLSAEPLLAPINLNSRPFLINPEYNGESFPIAEMFDWVVVGAESGAEPQTVQDRVGRNDSLVVQYFMVPVFVKQLDINGTGWQDINKFRNT